MLASFFPTNTRKAQPPKQTVYDLGLDQAQLNKLDSLDFEKFIVHHSR